MGMFLKMTLWVLAMSSEASSMVSQGKGFVEGAKISPLLFFQHSLSRISVK